MATRTITFNNVFLDNQQFARECVRANILRILGGLWIVGPCQFQTELPWARRTMTRLSILVSRGTPSIHRQAPIKNYRFPTARFDGVRNLFSYKTTPERIRQRPLQEKANMISSTSSYQK